MEAQQLAPGSIVKNRYRVTRLVGGGGMAWVYQVSEDLPDGRSQIWAMKELRADSSDMQTLLEGRQLFEQEANLLVTLNHPGLPKVTAFFEEAGKVYLVMEFVTGESLEKRLEHTNAPLLELTVVDWAIQICEVLSYLHTCVPPIIFRDMKPSNVMITPTGRIKLIDFGIARTYKVGKSKDTITMGSENYAAPEQWGKSQTDARADIFGLGATMYHLLTNIAPLPTFVPTARVPVRQYNPALSERVAEVIDCAMSINREKRYPNTAAMQQALFDCLPRNERRRIELLVQQIANPSPTLVSQPPVANVALSERATPSALTRTQAAATIIASVAPVADPDGYSKPCPICQVLNRPGARFCRRCAHPFVPPLPPTLKVLMPPQAHWELPVRDGETLIGRQGGAQPVHLDLDFYDPDGFVSRNHAKINAHARRYVIYDLDSANGTFVNGERLTPNQGRPLCDDDRIRLGRIVMQFRIR
ncbi:MAG: protein kinase domain-containing protein [Anaerolineae bacterium]